MQSADLQACLGFLQAIHYSAKVANVNKEVCRSLSRVVGRIRPLLEEVDMVDGGQENNASLRMIESSLENIQVAIGRFSTMGYLQSVLEAQAMCDNFSRSRDSMMEALERLAESLKPYSTKDWCYDIHRVCELLKGLRFEDCDHLQVAKAVHATARQIIDGEISVKSGQVIIRSQLLANRRLGSKAMQDEIQGLERELSRARVEKEQHEVEELHTIIRALKQSSSDSEQDSRPQAPVEYLCPISRRIMKDPVVLVETGQTYDRKYIEEWFGRGNRTCPATKQIVEELHLTPNYALKSLASSWLDVNQCREEEEEDEVFPRSPDVQIGEDPKPLPGGYEMKIDCAYSTMEIPSVEQTITSTTTLNSQLGIENCGTPRESLSGKEDLQKPLHAMQTQSVVNPLATTSNTSMGKGINILPMPYSYCEGGVGRQNAASLVPSLYSSKILAARMHSKFADLAETRSTDQYEASTPRSTFSELPKRMSSVEGMGLCDAIEALKAARRLQFEKFDEEHTPRSARSANKVLFKTDKLPPTGRTRRQYGPPSVCSGISKASKEQEYQVYAELDKIENGSEAGTEQQATDDCDEESLDSLDFDAASLTTIGSEAPTKYAGSVCSVRPTKPAVMMAMGFMQGATNVLFGEDEDEEGSLAGQEEEEANDVSLPVMANLLKTNDPELAASLASDLAIKAQTDLSILQDIPRLDIIPSLVRNLRIPSDSAKAAAARALGVIGERSEEARVQILNAGAIQILSQLHRQAEKAQGSNPAEEGSLDDVAAATSFALGALNSNTRDAPSVDVSPQMLIELLMSDNEELQASAVLELLDKLNSVYSEIVLKELTQAGATLTLVDILESSEEEVQFATAEILSKMIFHDQKTQKELSQSIGIVSKLLRLVKQGGPEDIACKSAAAQVLRGLAHNNSKIREDMLKRGIIPELAPLLCCNDMHTRETAAWLLGYMASHSQSAQEEVLQSDQAMFLLEEIAESGMAQEKVAAKFALRSVNRDDVGIEDEDELSSPIVIQSLRLGTKTVKIAAAWELCRMASSNQWSQIEIYECGGVTAILTYLKARPGSDGIQACLATLVKLASGETRIAAQICQEGGVQLAVRYLKSPATPDKKLVIQLLTVLAEKCPLHQQEVVSNGAVPVLVDLLFSEEVICKAASQALACLIENDMSVICYTVAENATPTLLDIVANEESPSFSKKAAVQLLGKMGEATIDCQQVVVQNGGIDVLGELLRSGDDAEVMAAAAQAMKSLSRKSFRDQGVISMDRLVDVLKSTRQAHSNPGMRSMGEPVPKPLAMSTSLSSGCGSHSSGYVSSSTPKSHGRRPSVSIPSLVLPAVPEVPEKPEESDVDDSDDTQSATIQEAPDSPLSRTTYEPTPKKTPFESYTNSEYQESIPEEPVKPVPPLSSLKPMTKPTVVVQNLDARSRDSDRKKNRETFKKIVDNIREDRGHSKMNSADIGTLLGLIPTDRGMGSRLLRTGAVDIMVNKLRSMSNR